MQYLGSKNKIAKFIIPLLTEANFSKKHDHYVEPFVGGCNMIDKVDFLPRMGFDCNYYLIELWKSLQKGWIPPQNISKDQYNLIRKNPNDFEPCLVAFVGFLCSFGGKWFGGYAFNSNGNNYAERGSRCLLKQLPKIQDVAFEHKSFEQIKIPPNSLIYCDPPYQNTTKYKDSIDYAVFWQWCRDQARNGHTVFVSEYSAPEDFECVAKIKHKTILDKNSNYERIEKLFKIV